MYQVNINCIFWPIFSEIEVRRPPPSDLTQSSPDTITVSGNWTQDAFKSTMWLGTEDGW